MIEVEQTLATQAAELVEQMRRITCPSCGGSGTYSEAHDYSTETLACQDCEGTGKPFIGYAVTVEALVAAVRAHQAEIEEQARRCETHGKVNEADSAEALRLCRALQAITDRAMETKVARDTATEARAVLESRAASLVHMSENETLLWEAASEAWLEGADEIRRMTDVQLAAIVELARGALDGGKATQS